MNYDRPYLPLRIRNLTISTRIRLHPKFLENPMWFAEDHGVDLVRDVYPKISFKKDKDTKMKVPKVTANIDLVQENAIRLLTERDADGDWITGIQVDPVLLCGVDHPLIEHDLLLALIMLLKIRIAPLLADPQDARHIVPGLADDDSNVASWSAIESELLISDIDLLCFHGVSHPDTGPKVCITDKRLKLGDRGDCVILIESAKWTTVGPGATREIQGVRVRLRLRGNALLAGFKQSGKTSLVGHTMRLVTFRASRVGPVFQEYMSKLGGFYLSVPRESIGTGKPVTTAKVLAVLSHLVTHPLVDLGALRDGPSIALTRKPMTKDVTAATDWVKLLPVSRLLCPEVYTPQPTGNQAHNDLAFEYLASVAYVLGTSSH